jgi:hypothetical protein
MQTRSPDNNHHSLNQTHHAQKNGLAIQTPKKQNLWMKQKND